MFMFLFLFMSYCRVGIHALSMYTRCFLRNVALSSWTCAASPRWTFFAASSWCRFFDAGGKEWVGTVPMRWIKVWHWRKS